MTAKTSSENVTSFFHNHVSIFKIILLMETIDLYGVLKWRYLIIKPSLHHNFFGTVPVWIWPRCLEFAAWHPPFLSCKWKNSWHECPKHTGAETMWIGSLGPRMFWGTRATNFSLYTIKMEGAGPQIRGTWPKFKRVLCQKSCRVNRA